jgi:hypothetical protein
MHGAVAYKHHGVENKREPKVKPPNMIIDAEGPLLITTPACISLSIRIEATVVQEASARLYRKLSFRRIGYRSS